MGKAGYSKKAMSPIRATAITIINIPYYRMEIIYYNYFLE